MAKKAEVIMERIKGKLKLIETKDTFSLFFQNDQFFCYVSKVWPDAKARAEHLVACWNAFEKDGLVGELVDGIKTIHTARENFRLTGEIDKKALDKILDNLIEKIGKI